MFGVRTSLCEPCSWRLVEFPVFPYDFENALTFLLRRVSQTPEYPTQEHRWTSLISNEICCGARMVDLFRFQNLKLVEVIRTENSKMECQDFWIFKFRLVFLKVLLNAVLLSYHAPELVHGAQRTKQKKISNFDTIVVAVHKEASRFFFCFVLRAPWTDSRAW